MRRLLTHTLVIGTMLGAWAFAEQTTPEQRSRALEVKELAVPFKGITANGQVEPGLFSLKSTGVSTEPVRKAAEIFLASLTPEQRQKSTFAHDSDEFYCGSITSSIPTSQLGKRRHVIPAGDCAGLGNSPRSYPPLGR